MFKSYRSLAATRPFISLAAGTALIGVGIISNWKPVRASARSEYSIEEAEKFLKADQRRHFHRLKSKEPFIQRPSTIEKIMVLMGEAGWDTNEQVHIDNKGNHWIIRTDTAGYNVTMADVKKEWALYGWTTRSALKLVQVGDNVLAWKKARRMTEEEIDLFEGVYEARKSARAAN